MGELKIWDDGSDMVIAETPEEASEIWEKCVGVPHCEAYKWQAWPDSKELELVDTDLDPEDEAYLESHKAGEWCALRGKCFLTTRNW